MAQARTNGCRPSDDARDVQRRATIAITGRWVGPALAGQP
jgi:hypothetical protein